MTDNPPEQGSPSQSDQGFLAKAKKAAQRSAAGARAAAQVTAKQAEKTKIANVTLPSAFLKLGKHIYEAGNYREEFADSYAKIDELRKRIAELKKARAVEGEQSFTNKAKAAAQKAKDATSAKALSVQMSNEVRRLGHAAYDAHGEASGPADLIEPIAGCNSRIESLDSDIREIEGAYTGHFFTPKRIAIGAGAVALLLVLGAILGRSPQEGAAPSFGLQLSSTNRDDVADTFPTPSKAADVAKDISLPPLSPPDKYGFRSGELSVGPNDEKLTIRERYANDEKSSRQIVSYEQGFETADGDFVMHGVHTVWFVSTKRPATHDDHQLKLIQFFRNGKVHGDHFEWYPSGALRVKMAWNNDAEEGDIFRWHENGQPLAKRTFREGVLTGASIEWYDDGALRAVKYYNGSSLGDAIFWYPDGKLQGTSVIRNNKKHGRCITWYSNGQKSFEGVFIDGEEDGIHEEWHENGQLKSKGSYVGGLESGVFEKWHENGTLIHRIAFDMGKPTSEQEWYDDGRRRAEGSFNSDGEPHGTCTQWYHDGTVLLEYHFSNGKKNGICIDYHVNGQPSVVQPFVDDQLHGTVRRFEPLGEVFLEANYVGGKLHGDYKVWGRGKFGKRYLETYKTYRNGIPIN